MNDQRSAWARLRSGGIIDLVGDRGRRTDVILILPGLLLGYSVGIGFLSFARWSGTEIATREIWLGGLWFALPTAFFGVREARRRRRSAPRPPAAPVEGTAGVTSFLGGAFALAVAQWAAGGLRFVLWVVGLALVTVGLRAGVERARSRAFHRAVALGGGVWLASVVLHAVSQ